MIFFRNIESVKFKSRIDGSERTCKLTIDWMEQNERRATMSEWKTKQKKKLKKNEK